MSLTFQQIILDAKDLVGKISEQEATADNLICEVQTVYSQIDNMKQFQEEVDVLYKEVNQRPHSQLIAEIQQENKYIQEIQAENKELRCTLKEHQSAIELMMSKYRQQTSALLKQSKPDFTTMQNTNYTNIITRQAEKINEMAAVMKSAVKLDEENELKLKEAYACLLEENKILRELVNAANEHLLPKSEPLFDNKNVQTD